jgi:hypothetical protein
MGRLWIVIGSIVTVVAIAFATYNIVNLVAHEEVTERTTFDADGVAAVKLHNDIGSVEIVGDDVDQITLVAEISHGLRRTVTEAAVEGDTLVVDMDCPTGLPVWCSVDYHLVVPRDLDVDARNDNGRLTLRDLDGDVIASGDNGGIELARLSGDVEVDTQNGGIRAGGLRGEAITARSQHGSVRLTFAAAPITVIARTSDGAVEVVVPDDGTTYRVDADNFVGSIDAAIRTDPDSDRSISAITRNGSVTVRYPTG